MISDVFMHEDILRPVSTGGLPMLGSLATISCSQLLLVSEGVDAIFRESQITELVDIVKFHETIPM